MTTARLPCVQTDGTPHSSELGRTLDINTFEMFASWGKRRLYAQARLRQNRLRIDGGKRGCEPTNLGERAGPLVGGLQLSSSAGQQSIRSRTVWNRAGRRLVHNLRHRPFS